MAWLFVTKDFLRAMISYSVFQKLIPMAMMLGTMVNMMSQTEDVLRPKGRPVTKAERAMSSWESHPERIPVSILAEAGMNLCLFRQDLQRTFPIGTTPNDVLREGSGVGWWVGVGAEYQFRSDAAFQLRMSLERKQYSNSINGVMDFQDSVTQLPRDMAFKAATSSSLTYLSIAPSIRYSFSPQFFATVGVCLQARVTDVYRNDELTITDTDPSVGMPVNYQLSRGLFRSTTRTISANTDMLQPIEQRYPARSTEFVQYHTWRTGIEAGVGILQPINPRTAIVAQLRYQFSSTALSNAFMVTDYSRSMSQRLTEITYENARIHSIQLILGIWFKYEDWLP